MVNGTPRTLNELWVTEITSMENSSAAILDSTHYTLLNPGTITSQVNITNTSLADGTYFFNYTYLERNSAFNTSISGEQSFVTFGDFLGVIAIVIVLVVIVGLLLGVIALFTRR